MNTYKLRTCDLFETLLFIRLISVTYRFQLTHVNKVFKFLIPTLKKCLIIIFVINIKKYVSSCVIDSRINGFFFV